MAKVLVTEAYLNDIADAIRAKNGGSATYKPGQMAGAIANLPDAPVLQSKTVTENGTVVPDEGYDGLSSVVVNVQGGGGAKHVVNVTFTMPTQTTGTAEGVA